MPFVYEVDPLVRVAQTHAIRGEVRVCMPPVVERSVVVSAELALLFRFRRRMGIVPQADAKPPMNDAAAHAFGTGAAALQQRNRMAESLRMRSERDLVQVPEARLIVVRIREVV